MFRKRTIAIAVFMFSLSLLAVCIVPGQEPPEETDQVLVALNGSVSSFLEGVSSGQTQGAYDTLLAGSQLLKQEKALQSLVEKTNELEEKYGKYKGFGRIAAARVADDLVLLRYLYKCENFPIVWYFTFYRTPGATPPENNNWRVIAIRFDTELELLAL